MQPAVERYPDPPGAVASTTHAVHVDGVPMLVERYTDICYARFAMRGPVTVGIEVSRPIGSYVVFPEARTATRSVHGNRLTLQLDTPESVVVWIDDLDKLCLLADPPIGDDLPARDALQVTDFGADPSGTSLATVAIQAAIDTGARGDRPQTVVIPADDAHAVDGLTLKRIGVNGHHLRNEADARMVANLTIGEHVRRVAFE